jgi:hypothetical protein
LTRRRIDGSLVGEERENSMATIRITRTTDEHDCDDCGPGFASGASVDIDGNRRIDLDPSAHCFDGVSYSRLDIYSAILVELGQESGDEDEAQCRQAIEGLGFEIAEEDGD